MKRRWWTAVAIACVVLAGVLFLAVDQLATTPPAPRAGASALPGRFLTAAEMGIPPELLGTWRSPKPAGQARTRPGPAFALASSISAGDSHAVDVCTRTPDLALEHLRHPDFHLDAMRLADRTFAIKYPERPDFHLHLVDAAGANLATVWKLPGDRDAIAATLPPSTAVVLAVVPAYQMYYPHASTVSGSEIAYTEAAFIPADITSFDVCEHAPAQSEIHSLTPDRFGLLLRGMAPEWAEAKFLWSTVELRPLFGVVTRTNDGELDWHYVLVRETPLGEASDTEPDPGAPPTEASPEWVHVTLSGDRGQTAFYLAAPAESKIETDPPLPVDRATHRLTVNCAGQPHYLSIWAWPVAEDPAHVEHKDSQPSCAGAPSDRPHEHALDCQVTRAIPDAERPTPPAIGSVLVRCVPVAGDRP